MKWSDALVLVYSITNNESFQLIQEYLENIYEILKKIADDPNETKNDNKAPVKIILLGNKIDLERYRQVHKQEVELTVEKYLNNSSTNNNKTNDLTSSLSSENVNLNLTHMESTNCDEYDVVQNIFFKIIRDVRRDREIHLIANPLVINEENISPSNNIHIKHNSFKARFHNNHQSFLSKRSKSPKIIPNLIIQDANQLNNTVSVQPSSAPGTANLISFQSNNININSSNSTLNSGNSVKKNKFPFFTKILNKS